MKLKIQDGPAFILVPTPGGNASLWSPVPGATGFDPLTVGIEADLSRNDVLALHTLCSGRDVVEVGSGGSTLLLARTARSLVSFEQERDWFLRVDEEMLSRSEGRCSVTLVHRSDPKPPDELPKAFVYFIDGADRNAWLSAVIKQGAAAWVVVHDSRRDDLVPSLTALVSWPEAGHISCVHYHYMESNLIAVELRPLPVEYANWNVDEKTGRLPHLHEREKVGQISPG